VVDDNAFAKAPSNFDIGAERGSKEMTLAWERWHKQLSQAIYTRWQNMAQDPGRATVRISVTKDRTIRAQILRSTGGPMFDQVVLMAIESINGNPGLTFPAKSQRQHVSFEADYIAASNVTPGFSWVKNDYEKVREDY
jgi:outer membrane biosynthesis protein TonB